MKTLRLRFHNYNKEILLFLCLTVFFFAIAVVAFTSGEIGGGIFIAVFGAIMLAALCWYLWRRVGVVIDFKRNLLKMRSGSDKRSSSLDEVKNIEIVFHYVDKMHSYSAQVTAHLKRGRTISVKFSPERSVGRMGGAIVGGMSLRDKLRMEKKIQSCPLISCRTIN